MKRLFTLLLIVCSSSLIAQPCLPEGITFTTQEQVDSFEVNYPGCTVIEGNVHIQGNDISNLNGLFVLDAIVGSLTIGGEENLGTSLIDLYGLYYLETIGGELSISFNPYLNSLSGLNNINSESIQALTIYSNPLLFLCDIPSICNYLAIPGAQVLIANNGPECNSPEEVIIDCENNCLPEGIYFTSQQQIDNFQSNYPGCTEITGYVTIEGNNISNLQGLNIITSLHKRLLIGKLYPDYCNPNLESLTGLENLTYIGGWLGLYWNSALTNCTGLNNLSQISGHLKFWGNSGFTNLYGLENLTSIGQFLQIRSNPTLENLTGLENLITVGEQLTIDFCPALYNLTGLGSLHSIGGYLNISDNNNLNSLTGLNSNNPFTIGGKLYITDNSSLTNLNGLNIFPASITELIIHDNPSLYSCEIQPICDYLSDSLGIVEIYDNAPGCNSPEQVIESCLSCLPDDITFNNQEQIDSFQVMYPECWHIKGNVSIIGYNEISNLNGLNVLLSIGGNLEIKNNYNLTNLTGLENLTTIWGDLLVEGNEILNDFTGFDNLTNIGGTLWIEGNEHLVSLTGLDSISPNSIYYLHIANNPLLSKCHVISICEYLLIQWGAEIYENAIGCNSPEEVYEICWNNIDDMKDNTTSFKVYPTPTEKWLNIKAKNSISLYSFEIRNLFGQILLEEKNIQSTHYTMNVAGLKAGVYFYVIKEKGVVLQQGKLIIK